MSEWVPIRYRGFHDVPRLLCFEHGGRLLLLESRFDPGIDDHTDDYVVMELPEDARARLGDASWEDLPALGRAIGSIAVDSVRLDPTSRRMIDVELLGRLQADDPDRVAG